MSADLSAYVCMDCQVNTRIIQEYYMVNFAIWREVVPERKGMLCIGCLEDRLGRTLNKEDFHDCPLNEDTDNWKKSERLKNRLTKEPEYA